MNKKFYINHFSSENFKNLLQKKCSYLDNLSFQNSKSLKSLRAQKLNILFDQSSEKKNNFQRNYSIFTKNKNIINNIKSYEKSNRNKFPNILPNIKIELTSPEESEYPEKYQKNNFISNNISGLYLKANHLNIKRNENNIKNNAFINKKSNNDNLPIISRRNIIPIHIKKNITLS